MVQVGSALDREQEGQDKQSWTQQISEAVREFVQTINHSSQQLASAAERFANDSLSLVDEAASRAQESAKTSSAMADAARQASDSAREAAESLQRTIDAAGERIRTETQASIDDALAQARETLESGKRVKGELQQQAQDVLDRVNESARSVEAAVAGAQQAAEQAQNAAQRAESQAGRADASVSNTQQAVQEARGIAARVESTASGVAGTAESAQNAAERSAHSAQEANEAAERAQAAAARLETTAGEARAAAEQAQQVIARIGEAAAAAGTAQQAAETASDAALRAERAATSGGQPAGQAQPSQPQQPSSLDVEASDLLARLEDDYQLLTSLVQELAGRVSNMTSVAAALESAPTAEPETANASSAESAIEPEAREAAPAPPAPEYFPPPSGPSAFQSTEHRSEAAHEQAPAASLETGSAESSAVEGIPDGTDAAPESGYFDPAWIETTLSYRASVSSEAPSLTQPFGAPPEDSWRDIEFDEVETRLEGGSETPASPTAPDCTPPGAAGYGTQESAAAASSPFAAESAQPEQPSAGVVLSGRVQVTLSPVPDFDHLLNLDTALSHIPDIETVTLADYTQEEVMFRVDIVNPLPATDFASRLGQTSGLGTQIVDASPGAISLRLV